MGLFGRKKFKPLADYSDEWAVMRGDYNDNPLFVRIRTSLSDAVGHPDYPVQVGVAVPLTHPDENGLPTSVESEQLTGIEDALVHSLTGLAELAAVLTTSGMREFVFYAPEAAPDVICERVTGLSTSCASHTLQLSIQHDPSWNVFTGFAQ
ncbi:hypothetical protein TPB0596_39930 [Tsukamurella pulmonis]|uniref:DUF695 domain-containing protein n=1 Tax=Tsukamurella pulmonis TaxID=47312 RepID=UPI001EDDFCD9|nr:DUF695 domain-containing protein [Tsukamurella pulmonis]BDD84230.1 hypothetical protein TPB0596_39930 [Tsukamurella pulmonis]